MDEGTFTFEKLFYEEVVAIASSYQGRPGDPTWKEIEQKLNHCFMDAIATDPPIHPTVNRPALSPHLINAEGPCNRINSTVEVSARQASVHLETSSHLTLPMPQNAVEPMTQAASSPSQPPTTEHEQPTSLPCENLHLSDILDPDVLDDEPITCHSLTRQSLTRLTEFHDTLPISPALDADTSTDHQLTVRMSDIEGSLHETPEELTGDEMDTDEEESVEIDDEGEGAEESHTEPVEIQDHQYESSELSEDPDGSPEEPEEPNQAPRRSSGTTQSASNDLQCDDTINERISKLFLATDSELSEPDEDQGNPTSAESSDGPAVRTAENRA